MAINKFKDVDVAYLGTKDKNELGMYDMSGNIWEWCQDWYDADYYSNSPSSNPKGPGSGSYRVLRGGNWGYDASDCRISCRYFSAPGDRGDGHGLRLALAP